MRNERDILLGWGALLTYQLRIYPTTSVIFTMAANLHWGLSIRQTLFWMLPSIVSFTLHNKPFNIGAVLQKKSGGTMAQGDLGGQRRARLQTQAVWHQKLALTNTHTEKRLHSFCLSLETHLVDRSMVFKNTLLPFAPRNTFYIWPNAHVYVCICIIERKVLEDNTLSPHNAPLNFLFYCIIVCWWLLSNM